MHAAENCKVETSDAVRIIENGACGCQKRAVCRRPTAREKGASILGAACEMSRIASHSGAGTTGDRDTHLGEVAGGAAAEFCRRGELGWRDWRQRTATSGMVAVATDSRKLPDC